MAWTDAMVEKLKELWSQGVTTGEIGKRLGISKNSIVGKVHRLGLEGRPSPIKKSSDETPAVKDKKTSKKAEKKVQEAPIKTEVKKEKSPVSTKKEKNKEPKNETKAQTTPVAPKKNTVKVDSQIEEDDIKLIKSLEVKSEKDYQKENIALIELDNHTCRWPLGDPKDPDFHFCGRKVKTGQTYCEEHSAIAYVKPVRR